MVTQLLIVLVGLIAGVVTGLIGASGVMVIVPGLVMLGYGAADAIGASLFADTVASLVVSWTYYQAGNVNLRQGWWIAVGSVLGAQVGSYISPHIAESSLGGFFGIFLIITAVIFALRGMGTVIPVSGQPTEANASLINFLNFLGKTWYCPVSYWAS